MEYAMGATYLLTSAGLLFLELILQLYMVVISSRESVGQFVVLLVLVVVPVIVVNIFSAIQVTRTQDFSGKECGRIICVVFHSLQSGIFWRALKLAILYDKKDWTDYLNMRLFHCGFQSLPFAITLSHSMFRDHVTEAARIITVIVSLLSASFTLTLYRTGNKIYESDGIDGHTKIGRKRIGIVFLFISTCLMVLSRCSSIVLFSIVQLKWIALPIGVHFLVHAAVTWCRTDCPEGRVIQCAVKVLCLSHVNIFDMTGKDYNGVKCSYVLFYSAMLVENLVMSSYWMLTSESDERFRLMTVMVVILCFIIGVILKFASCGCIFNIESDILSDAFNNPELKADKDFDSNIEVTASNNRIKSSYDQNDIAFRQMQVENECVIRNDTSLVDNRTKSHSRDASPVDKNIISPRPSQKVLHSYENKAFAKSQGNISLSADSVNDSRSRSRDSHDRSRDSHKHSHDSQNRSRDSHKGSREDKNRSHNSSKEGSNKRSQDSNRYSDEKNRSRQRRLNGNLSKSIDDVDYSFDLDEPSLVSTPENSERTKIRNRQRLKVSDKSIHATDVQQTPMQQPKFKGQGPLKASNADLASSNSRYSRNTNTLNGSVQNYRYNGFNDPFREKRLLEIANQKLQYHKEHKYHCPHKSRHRDGRIDFSLDSADLYPSMSSDTSSMTSSSIYHPNTYRVNQKKKKDNKRNMYRNRKLPTRTFATNDGYSTDVSNSDYLSSLNDFSMTDSASWTESSSSSDGAVTWPPSHSSNLLKMYDIPDKVSSQDNVMLWLDTMDSCLSDQDSSFTSMREPSIASETDISLSAMQTFEVKTTKKRFKKLIPKPKDVILKFRSLNYKGKEKHLQDRPYPLSKAGFKDPVIGDKVSFDRDLKIKGSNSKQTGLNENKYIPTVPLPVDSVQESIV